jgi:hypothetical protein
MLNNIFRKRKRPFLGRVNHHKDANGPLFVTKKKEGVKEGKGGKKKKRGGKKGGKLLF